MSDQETEQTTEPIKIIGNPNYRFNLPDTLVFLSFCVVLVMTIFIIVTLFGFDLLTASPLQIIATSQVGSITAAGYLLAIILLIWSRIAKENIF